MYITDKNGYRITITDLDAAIAQAENFQGLRHHHANGMQKHADDERQSYWKDIYQKLLQLRAAQVLTQ